MPPKGKIILKNEKMNTIFFLAYHCRDNNLGIFSSIRAHFCHPFSLLYQKYILLTNLNVGMPAIISPTIGAMSCASALCLSVRNLHADGGGVGICWSCVYLDFKVQQIVAVCRNHTLKAYQKTYILPL